MDPIHRTSFGEHRPTLGAPNNGPFHPPQPGEMVRLFVAQLQLWMLGSKSTPCLGAHVFHKTSHQWHILAAGRGVPDLSGTGGTGFGYWYVRCDGTSVVEIP